jgi:hypothetical protein
MSRRGHAGARVIWASILAGVFAMSADSAASAATSCLTRPGQYGGPGTHWFYRIDRATQRRCWYLKQIGPTESRARSPEREAASENADSQSTFMSWLSAKVSGVAQPSTTETEQSTATRWAPAPRAEPRPPRRTRVASRSQRTSSRAERARAPRTSQQSPPLPAARAEAPATAPAIDPATSEALYREYLQWRVKQLFTPE